MGDNLEIKEAIPITKNKTYYFILPLLVRNGVITNIINCYLGDEVNKTKYTFSKIFVQTRHYSDRYTQINEFKESYQLEDESYMFVYNIPEQFIEDYHKFCHGQYSKMSDNAKDLICKFSSVRPIQDSKVYKILYKTVDQKKFIEDLVGEQLPIDAEVSSIPDMDKEIYRYCKIKHGRLLV